MTQTKLISRKKDWHLVEYFAPITESLHENESGDFIIKGTAINDTTTRNGVTYTSEELSRSAKTLINKPILKDHNNSVDSIVGKTINAYFDESKRNIQFEAKIMDEDMRKKISMGLISSVSVGAFVRDIEERETESGMLAIAKGIDFVELSLVAVPADPNAGFGEALAESLSLKRKVEEKTSQDKEIAEKHIQEKLEEAHKMAEEVKAQAVVESSEATLKEAKAKTEALEAQIKIMQEERLSELREKYTELATERGIQVENAENLDSNTLKVLISTLKQVEMSEEDGEVDADDSEEASEEADEEPQEEGEVKEEKMVNTQVTKGRVGVTSKEELAGYNLEKGGEVVGYGMWRTPESIAQEGVHKKLARVDKYEWE